MELDAKGELRFFRPDGRPLPAVPEPPPLPADLLGSLERAHDELGLEFGPWTTTPEWRGEPLDLDFALTTLRRE